MLVKHKLIIKYLHVLRGGGGGGGGVYPVFFVELDFEIAVDQQTKSHDKTFEGVPDSGCPRDSPALIWSIFGSILQNHLNMLKILKNAQQITEFAR